MPKRRKSANTAKHHKSVANALLKEPTHPAISNFVVLQNLFEYRSSFQEVQQNRLVCKTWLQASNSTWKIMTTPIVLYRGAIKETLNRLGLPESEHSSHNGEAHMTLEELWRSCHTDGKNTNIQQLKNTVMARKYVLRNWNFDENVINLIRNPLDTSVRLPAHEMFFWTQVAPSVVLDLCLDTCVFPGDFIPFPNKFLEAFPKLHRLQINNHYTRGFTHSEANAGMAISLKEDLDSEPGAFLHSNLKTLEIITNGQYHIVRHLVKLLEMSPNLKRLKVHGLREDEEEDLCDFRKSHLGQLFEEIDFLDFSLPAHREGGYTVYKQLSTLKRLKVLRHDIGFDIDHFRDVDVNYNKMTSLEELHLYRGIFSLPKKSFDNMWNCTLPNLTVLYLWGNMSDNLQFLRNFPNLKKLVWNTSCFDPKYFGKRTFSLMTGPVDPFLGRVKAFPLMDSDFTENTIKAKGQLPILQSLEHLEIDWTLKSYNSWVILAKCMPNLVHLKVKTSGRHEMVLINNLWKNLHTLDIAHGSNLHPMDLANGLNAFRGSHLKTLGLPKCPCIVAQGADFDSMGNKFNETVGALYGININPYEVYSTNKKESLNEFVCLKAQYTKMLETGNVNWYWKLQSNY